MRSPQSRLLVAAAVAIGAAMAPAGASALAPLAPFRTVSPVAYRLPAVNDDRYVVYASAPTTLQVIDDSTDERFEIAIPCATSGDPSPVLAVGGGQAMIGCGRTRVSAAGDRPLLLDLATRTWHEVPAAEAIFARYDVIGTADTAIRFADVGRRWIRVSAGGYHWSGEMYTNWHTSAEGAAPTASTTADLDAEGLIVPLCSLVQRRAQSDREDLAGALTPLEDVAFAPPYALTSGVETALELHRCGSPETVVLESGRSDGMATLQAQLSRDLVSWNARVPRIYRPECGIQLTWADDADAWFHTDRSLYRANRVDAPQVGSPQTGWQVEQASLPDCAGMTHTAGVRVSSGGRTVQGLATGGSWLAGRDVQADVISPPRARLARLSVAPGGRVTVRTAVPARSLRWSVGGGAWHAAARQAGRWVFAAPRRLRRTRTLTLDVRPRAHGRVRQQLTLGPRAGASR